MSDERVQYLLARIAEITMVAERSLMELRVENASLRSALQEHMNKVAERDEQDRAAAQARSTQVVIPSEPEIPVPPNGVAAPPEVQLPG